MSRAMPARRRRLLPIAVLLMLCGLLTPALSAVAASAGESALCDGAPDGCRLTTDDVVKSGDELDVAVVGNPDVAVSLRFYLIEFNSGGAITGLKALGSAARTTTSASGIGHVTFLPGAGHGDSNTPGGWGFVGFSDDDNLDLTRRLGAIVAFGNNTVRLLGDGYAYQKPVGTELEMQLIGNKVAGYWVEYQDDKGAWVAVPGQGPDDQVYLRNSPGEIAAIPYTIPAGLTQGKPYTFRLNSSLNKSGKDAGFTEWIVVPSDSPKKQGRGKNFNPSLPAGKPDRVEPVPSYTPKPSQSPTPSTSPKPSKSAKPTRKPTPRPTPTRTPSLTPSATVSATPTPSATPSPTPTPTNEPPQPTPSATTTADGAVWGNEATPPPATPTVARPASFPVATAVAALLVLLAAAPLGWWGWSRHRLASRALEDLT